MLNEKLADFVLDWQSRIVLKLDKITVFLMLFIKIWYSLNSEISIG